MQIDIFDSPDILAQLTARKIIDMVSRKPNALLCLAGGETPRLTYQYIVEGAKNNGIDFSLVQFVSLDEWVGIPASNKGSCYYFLHETIFEPLAIKQTNIHFFNSTAGNLSAECERINQIIQNLGGIDLMLVGIGMNGHIGFNEPGISPYLFAHVIELDIITQQVGQKYFSEITPLQKGISLGMAQFMQSGMVILLATGNKKAPIIKKALEENVSAAVPAGFIQEHTNAFVLLDSEAAGLLS
ncbi:MAG TPA: glucosamine-6-phosphate deaminase [Chitinophagaceae bacterium]|nr:glucosamine-6-phosphate deaminase [Chitinophagaceae bacterium]